MIASTLVGRAIVSSLNLPRRAGAILAALLACGACIHGARAAERIWDGGGGDDFWLTAPNWDDDTVPAADDILTFVGIVRLTPNNNFTAGTRFNGITFGFDAGAFNVSGESILLGVQQTGTGITSSSDIINDSSNDQTIALGIALSAGGHAISNFSSTLNLNGPITRGTGSTAVFTQLGNAINVAGSGLATSNGILGGWATTSTGNWATLDGSNNVVDYTGYTDIDAGGTIADNPLSNVRIAATTTGAIALDSSTTSINSLLFSTGAAAQTVTVGAGNTLVLGQDGGIFNATAIDGALRALTIGGGTLTAGDGVNPAAITLSSAPFGGTATGMTISAAITDNGAAPVSVTVQGGYMSLTGTNTHSGGTYILSGRVSQPNVSTFGTGPVYIFPGGQTNPGVSLTNDFFIAGNGTAEGGGFGALRMFGGSVLSGTITLMDDASINPTNGSTDSITGKITGPGALMVGHGSGSQGSGTLVIGKIGEPAVPNDYAGDTTIAAAAGGSATATTLRISAADNNNIMPHGNTGNFEGGATGNLILDANDATRRAVFDLNGSTQTINGLSSTTTSPENNIVTSGIVGAHLRVGDSDATAVFGGIIEDGAFGTMAVTKIGMGTQTLTGANTYTGDTAINVGTLSITEPYLADLSDVWLTTGAVFDLNFDGADTIEALYFDGAAQAIGTYGSLASSATFKSDFFTGMGILNVTAIPEPATIAMLALAGGLGFVIHRRRRARG
jgi:autotransporter-associated beta strand protein